MTENQNTGAQAADEYCITVITDEDHQLGKHFAADGSKRAAVTLTDGQAYTVRCETHADLAEVLEHVSADPRMAIVLGHFGVPPGEEFRLVSRELMRQALPTIYDIPAGTELVDAQLDGVHELTDSEGGKIRAVCRTKANASSSVWMLVDRDIDNQTPEHFANLTQDEFMLALDSLLPGISQTTRVATLSSSARVTPIGQPQGSKAGHTFIRLAASVDRGVLKAAVRARALAGGMAWLVNKYSKADNTQVVAKDWRLLLDDSVLSMERLVFCGSPTADAESGLVVHPQRVLIEHGARVALDAGLCTAPPAEAVAAATKSAGREVKMSSTGGGSAAFRVSSLEPHTLLDTADGPMTLAQVAAALRPGGKMRCQAPFRESSSMAAFVSVTERGEPFVYDSGTSTSYFVEHAPAVDVAGMLRAASARAAQASAEPAAAQGQEVDESAPDWLRVPPALAPTAQATVRAPEIPEALIKGMPRMMREAYEWMMATAPRPQRELSFAAALSLMATVLGTRVKSPSGLRTNLYVISTAVTGAGKDHGRTCVRKVLGAAGLGAAEGGEPASGPAILARLADTPNTLLQLDEFGLLLAGCKEPRSPKYGIIKTFLEMTGAASSSLPGTLYADTKLRAAKPVSFPCLNLHCTSTPSTLYESLTGGDMASGFLNRVLLIESNAEMDTKLSMAARPELDQPPETLIHWMQSVAMPAAHEGGNMAGMTASSPATVRAHPLAEQAFQNTSAWLAGAVKIAKEAGMADLWSRFGAMAIQLAIIHAAADHDADSFYEARAADALEAGLGSAQWAIAVTKHCLLRMEQLLIGNLSSTEHEALMNRVMAQLKKTGASKRGSYGGVLGHKRAALLNDRSISSAEPRLLKAAMEGLTASGRVRVVDFLNVSTRRTYQVYVLEEHLPGDDWPANPGVPGHPDLEYRHIQTDGLIDRDLHSAVNDALKAKTESKEPQKWE